MVLCWLTKLGLNKVRHWKHIAFSSALSKYYIRIQPGLIPPDGCLLVGFLHNLVFFYLHDCNTSYLLGRMENRESKPTFLFSYHEISLPLKNSCDRTCKYITRRFIINSHLKRKTEGFVIGNIIVFCDLIGLMWEYSLLEIITKITAVKYSVAWRVVPWLSNQKIQIYSLWLHFIQVETPVLLSFLVAGLKYPDRSHLREEVFTLDYSYRGHTVHHFWEGIVTEARGQTIILRYLWKQREWTGSEARQATSKPSLPLVTHFLQQGSTS